MIKFCPKTGSRFCHQGALYASTHSDNNDVQTISHKCEVLPYKEYKRYQARASHQHAACSSREVYYLAGTYEPTAGRIKFEPDVKLRTLHWTTRRWAPILPKQVGNIDAAVLCGLAELQHWCRSLDWSSLSTVLVSRCVIIREQNPV